MELLVGDVMDIVGAVVSGRGDIGVPVGVGVGVEVGAGVDDGVTVDVGVGFGTVFVGVGVAVNVGFGVTVDVGEGLAVEAVFGFGVLVDELIDVGVETPELDPPDPPEDRRNVGVELANDEVESSD